MEGEGSLSSSKFKSLQSRNVLLKEVGGLLEAHNGTLFLSEGLMNQDEITTFIMSFKWDGLWNDCWHQSYFCRGPQVLFCMQPVL